MLEWTLDRFVEEIRRYGPATSGGVSQFLGPADDAPVASNTTMMPAINRALGIAPPPLCRPDSEVTQLQDRLAAIWNELEPNQRKAWLALAGIVPEI